MKAAGKVVVSDPAVLGEAGEKEIEHGAG